MKKKKACFTREDFEEHENSGLCKKHGSTIMCLDVAKREGLCE